METIRKVSEMELWEVFSQLLNQKGVSIADIANATGLPYTTVDSIIKKKLNELAVVIYSHIPFPKKAKKPGPKPPMLPLPIPL